MANMRDVSRKAGVSVSTVSAVLNESKAVSPALRRRVLEAVEATGYELRKKRGEEKSLAGAVSVVLPGIHSSFFSPLLTGIVDAASETGTIVHLYDSKREWEREQEILGRLAKGSKTGLLLDSVCAAEREREYFGWIQRKFVRGRALKVVVVEREVGLEGIRSVSVNNFSAAYQLTTHLLGLGHRRIAHVMGSDLFPHSFIRAEGYRQALADFGVSFDAHLLVRGDYTPDSGYAAVSGLFHRGIRCTAVFCANDQMAVGAVKAIRNHGFSVPEDMAVAGFDNLPVASLIDPGLTTVQYPIYQMGYRAMRSLTDPGADPEEPAQIRLPTRLLIRGSTDRNQPQDWNLYQW